LRLRNILTYLLTYLPTLEEWMAELALGGWLVTYQNKCPAPEIQPGHDRLSQY